MISSPTSPSSTCCPCWSDHGEVPAVERVPDAHRPHAGQPGRARDDGGLGRAVGVPHLAAVARRAGRRARAGRPHRRRSAAGPRPARRAARGRRASARSRSTVIRCATSHGPRSMPVRTSARGAGTRHAPCAHASHISSHDASNATDSPASTRSPGPSGASCRNSRASASTKAAADRCVTATPLGVPVEPEVKMIQASSLEGRRPRAGVRTRRAASDHLGPVPQDDGHVGLGEHQARPLVRVVDVDRDVGRAGREHGQDRRRTARPCRTGSARRPGRRRARRRPQLGGPRHDLGAQLAVGEGRRAVVDRGGVAVRVDGGAEDVHQGAGWRGLVGAEEQRAQVRGRRRPLHVSTTSSHLDGGPPPEGRSRNQRSLSCTPTAGRNVASGPGPPVAGRGHRRRVR